MWTCDRCGFHKQYEAFDPWVLSNHRKHDRLLVCINCYKLGYSCRPPHGLKVWHCAAGHECGHLAFDRKLFADWLREKTSDSHLICKECKAKPKYKCSIDQGPYCRHHECYEWQFGQKVMKNFKAKPRQCRLVCNECCNRGFGTQRGGDVPRQCNGCHQWFGPILFSLKNNAKKKRLLCRACKQLMNSAN